MAIKLGRSLGCLRPTRKNSLIGQKSMKTGVMLIGPKLSGRRRVGETYDSNCVVPTVKFGGGSVMVWSCMSSVGPGILSTCKDRMNSNK